MPMHFVRLYPLTLFMAAALKFSPIYAQGISEAVGVSAPTRCCWLSQWSYPVVQGGYFWSRQGQQQHICINGLIGDEFTVANHGDSNYLLGLGYFFRVHQRRVLDLDCGAIGYFLPKTSVCGNVLQECAFSNLAYAYDITHYPIYVDGKCKFNLEMPKCTFNIDAGVGVNIMHMSNFCETPLNCFTIPDCIFAGRTRACFSATVGVGFELHRFGPLSLELGYRFFYLGHSSLQAFSPQVLDNLSTGNCFANALILSISI